MPIIRPISDLRNHFNQISDICHHEGEPVFITKNGKGDLVVMSLASYEKIEAQLDLYQKLGIAEQQSISNDGRVSHTEMMRQLRARAYGQE